MSIQIYLNKIGFPKIAELQDNKEIPGIGEKIALNTDYYQNNRFEVTEVKKNLTETYIYVNPVE